jgi:hypothetical protein
MSDGPQSPESRDFKEPANAQEAWEKDHLDVLPTENLRQAARQLGTNRDRSEGFNPDDFKAPQTEEEKAKIFKAYTEAKVDSGHQVKARTIRWINQKFFGDSRAGQEFAARVEDRVARSQAAPNSHELSQMRGQGPTEQLRPQQDATRPSARSSTLSSGQGK